MKILSDPSQLAAYSGINPDLQRDMRRRGHLENIGELQANGRWLYSVADVIALAISRLLVDRRMSDVGDAIRLGKYATPFVLSWLEPENPDDSSQARYRSIRYVASYGPRVAGDEAQFEAYRLLESVFQFSLGAAVVLDCQKFSDELRGPLAALIDLMIAARAAGVRP